MKVKNNELQALDYCLNNMKNSGLSGSSGWKVISLQEEIGSHLETYTKATQSIVKGFIKEGEEGIEPGDERHPLVMAKIGEAGLESVEVKNFNFLTQDELISATEGLNFDAIKLIKKFLAKTEEVAEELK